MHTTYWFLGKTLEIIDTFIVLFWSIGWFFPKRWSHAIFLHRLVVYLVAIAQFIFWWRCPLVLLSNYLYTLADPNRVPVDVFNPYTISTIQTIFKVDFNIANNILSSIIIGGALLTTIQILIARRKQH